MIGKKSDGEKQEQEKCGEIDEREKCGGRKSENRVVSDEQDKCDECGERKVMRERARKVSSVVKVMSERSVVRVISEKSVVGWARKVLWER